MKKKGNRSDFIGERNAELRAAFFSQDNYSTTDASLKKTLKTPTSRFWVDPDRARDVISRMEKDPAALECMNPERRRMYMALFSKYQKIKRQFPGESKIHSVTMAVYSGAPEFFLTPCGVRKILYTNS